MEAIVGFQPGEYEMSRYGFAVPLAPLAAVLIGLSACAPGAPGSAEAPPPESFAALQARGQQAMGVDQYTSTHLFDALESGGRIELQRDVDDPAGVTQIREHLQAITKAFSSGDFSTPAFVHMQDVPGASVMASKRELITYRYSELPRGGQVLITTGDPDAIEAIHAFMAFQRQDHHAGGAEHPGAGAMQRHDRMHPPGGMHPSGGMHQQGGMGAGMHGPVDGGMGGGMPGGMGSQGGMPMHGADAGYAEDMGVVHELLGGHADIERTVTHLPNGVRTVTRSRDPRVAGYIKEHVASMLDRLASGEVFNVASSTIPVVFANRDRIETEVEQTADGVVFTQTTDVPELVPVLQAHAAEVSELVREGMAAMMRSMMESAGRNRPGDTPH
jgi:hypothetical protein